MPPLPDPIWINFIKLGHVSEFKQKRRECKHCHLQINDALRPARTHFRNCTAVTSAQKRRYFGDLYNSDEEKEEEENLSTNTPSIHASTSMITGASTLATSSTSINTSTSTTVAASASIQSTSTHNVRSSKITNYIKPDHISKTEQQSLELAFARSVFHCGLFL